MCAKMSEGAGDEEGNAARCGGVGEVGMEVTGFGRAGEEGSIVMARGKLTDVTFTGRAFVSGEHFEQVCFLKEDDMRVRVW